MLYTFVDSPLGPLLASGERDGGRTIVTSLFVPGHDRGPAPGWMRDDAAFGQLRQEMAEYFAGERRDFTLAVHAPGTPFQRAVWDQLRRIDYGQTMSYAQVAAAVGAPTAVRAVGGANGRNPISIIVPCHRVVGSDGSLTGYGGGLPAKSWLLAHERDQLRHETGIDQLPFPPT